MLSGDITVFCRSSEAKVLLCFLCENVGIIVLSVSDLSAIFIMA